MKYRRGKCNDGKWAVGMTPFIGTLGIKEPTNEQFAKDAFEPF